MHPTISDDVATRCTTEPEYGRGQSVLIYVCKSCQFNESYVLRDIHYVNVRVV